MNHISAMSILAAGSLILAGCSSIGQKKADEEEQKSKLTETISLQKQLTMTAESIDRNSQLLAEANNTRAAVERAQIAPEQQARIDKSANFKEPFGMSPKISFEWTGPIQEVAQQMAARASYAYMGAEGRQPAIPVIVQIHAKEQSIAAILRDAGLQAGQRADIIIDEASKRVYVRFFD